MITQQIKFWQGFNASVQRAYARTDIRGTIEQIKSENPYSASVFIEPTNEEFDEINQVLSEHFSKDAFAAISGSWSRKVWNNCCNRILEVFK